MLSRARARLTYANVMATLAVFIALGGSSYAVVKVGSGQIVDNSVQSKDVRNNALKGVDVRNRSLSGADVRDGALTGADVGDDSLTGADIDESKLGRVPTADLATSTPLATFADRAGDAATLGGLGPAAFERSGRLVAGSGSLGAVPAQIVLSVPEVGVQLETDGDADTDAIIRVRNLTAGTILNVHTEDTGMAGVGDVVGFPAVQLFDTMQFSRAGAPSAGLVATCGYDTTAGTVQCFAVRFGP